MIGKNKEGKRSQPGIHSLREKEADATAKGLLRRGNTKRRLKL
jgi:hypothetical protein